MKSLFSKLADYLMKMIALLYSAALIGLECRVIEVEVDFRKGMSNFTIVGLGDKAVQEARERVMSAIRSTGMEFKQRKIVVNLAPADLPKFGPAYDLPIALGYLIATNQVEFNPAGKLFLGELALNGGLRSINGVLPICDAAQKLGFTELYVPAENSSEAALIPGIKVYPVHNLVSLISHFNGNLLPTAVATKSPTSLPIPQVDLAQIKGQMQARRAMEIAAAGGHNILLSGSPGSGKTMLARALPGILPTLSLPEALEVTRVYSISGKLSHHDPLINSRPFRSPHHTSSHVALVGGGSLPKPGEVTLAHRGVLFLDEFPEFSSQSLEALRQPLEDKLVTISRAAGSLQFPANFLLTAAMNPCKCGFAGDPDRECICTMQELHRYQRKISGPIMDRIDLFVNVFKLPHSQIMQPASDTETSLIVQQRVQSARNIQLQRYKSLSIYANADLSQRHIEELFKLDATCVSVLHKAAQRLNLTARSFYRILRVSRTIADLENKDSIDPNHISEALSLRHPAEV